MPKPPTLQEKLDYITSVDLGLYENGKPELHKVE